jgi:hypothetical protein
MIELVITACLATGECKRWPCGMPGNSEVSFERHLSSENWGVRHGATSNRRREPDGHRCCAGGATVCARAGATLMAVLAATGFLAPPARATDVDAAIVFAVDVSASIDPDTAKLQREGHAAALRSPEIIAAIARNRIGCIGIVLSRMVRSRTFNQSAAMDNRLRPQRSASRRGHH